MSEFNPQDDTAAANTTMESNEGLITALSPESDTKSSTCLCGAFKVQFSSIIFATIICHCHNCRKETSSMFGTWIVAPETDFTVTFPSSHTTSHGEIHRTFKQKVDSGNETTTHFCDKCSNTMYRTSTTYPGQIWIPQGAINDASLRDQKLKVEQWTSRRVFYLGGLPFTDKYTKNWTQDGTGRDDDADEKRKRTKGEVYDENYVEKVERVERVGEGVQAKAETENEVERVERVGEGVQARVEAENE